MMNSVVSKKITNYSIASILGLENSGMCFISYVKQNFNINFFLNNSIEQPRETNFLNLNQTSRNRARRARTNFNNNALTYLEDIFKTNQYPDITEREKLAKKIDTTEARIQVWFQNKRSRNRKFISGIKNEEKKADSFSSNDSYNSNDSGNIEASPKEKNVNAYPYNYYQNY